MPRRKPAPSNATPKTWRRSPEQGRRLDAIIEGQAEQRRRLDAIIDGQAEQRRASAALIEGQAERRRASDAQTRALLEVLERTAPNRPSA